MKQIFLSVLGLLLATPLAASAYNNVDIYSATSASSYNNSAPFTLSVPLAAGDRLVVNASASYNTSGFNAQLSIGGSVVVSITPDSRRDAMSFVYDYDPGFATTTDISLLAQFGDYLQPTIVAQVFSTATSSGSGSSTLMQVELINPVFEGYFVQLCFFLAFAAFFGLIFYLRNR